MFNNQDIVVFDIVCKYEHSADTFFGFGSESAGNYSVQEIPLVNDDVYNTQGFTLYLKDVGCIQKFTQAGLGYDVVETCTQGWILGSEFYVDLQKFPLLSDSWGSDVFEINYSDLYFEITPRINQTYGCRYDAHADLLNNQSDYYESTPSGDGEYTPDTLPVINPTNNYTYVTTDSNGNPIYNYYTINIDGITTPVNGDSTLGIAFTEPLQVYVNGSLGGGGSSSSSSSTDDDDINLTIEDDDYTDSALREDLKDGFGLIDDMTTPTANDGYLPMALSVFDSLNPNIEDIIGFGIASVVVVSIFRSAFRR